MVEAANVTAESTSFILGILLDGGPGNSVTVVLKWLIPLFEQRLATVTQSITYPNVRTTCFHARHATRTWFCFASDGASLNYSSHQRAYFTANFM